MELTTKRAPSLVADNRFEFSTRFAAQEMDYSPFSNPFSEQGVATKPAAFKACLTWPYVPLNSAFFEVSLREVSRLRIVSSSVTSAALPVSSGEGLIIPAFVTASSIAVRNFARRREESLVVASPELDSNLMYKPPGRGGLTCCFGAGDSEKRGGGGARWERV